MALILSPQPYTCGSPSMGPRRLLTCQIGTPQASIATPCDAPTCCKNLTTCPEYCVKNSLYLYLNDSMSGGFCDEEYPGDCDR